MVADPDRKNGRIGANGYMAANIGRPPFRFISGCRSPIGEQIIDEHHPMPDKTIVSDGHQFTNKGVGLDLAMIPDLHIFLYLIKRSDESPIAYLATIKVHRLDHRNAFPENHILPDAGLHDLYIHDLLKLE
jgi:hypothetical protein